MNKRERILMASTIVVIGGWIGLSFVDLGGAGPAIDRAAVEAERKTFNEMAEEVSNAEASTFRSKQEVANHLKASVDTSVVLPLGSFSLSASDDLYQAGLSSHASVNVMLALEAAFDVEFPDRLLTRSSFQSVAAIRQAVIELTGG